LDTKTSLATSPSCSKLLFVVESSFIMKIYIHTIYYNLDTKKNISQHFIPLDNSNNGNEWFEFLPILNYLQRTELEENAFYGFLSPKFTKKTGYQPSYVIDLITQYGNIADIFLFSPGWDQISYFLNPWEQGEVWHPGLMSASQRFLDNYGLKLNLSSLVTDTTNSVFSNYIVAKKNYWLNWLKIAKSFYCYAENENNLIKNQKICYGSKENQYPLKTFIQERFASLVMLNHNYKILTPDQSLTSPIFTKIFSDDINTRRLLITCDVLKKIYKKSLNPHVLETYWSTRNLIKFSLPN
jgi:hypothetical protein